MSTAPDSRDTKDLRTRRDSILAWQDWRIKRFPNLMRRRVDEILLVSSPYDAFSLEEDGLLNEAIYAEYVDLGLTHAPSMTRVSTGEEALAAIREGIEGIKDFFKRFGPEH